MTPDAERLFLEAVELPPERQRKFLRENCPTEDLRCEVESLLAGDERAESFLESAVVEAAESLQLVTDQPANSDIGSWRVTKVLGRGGMGIVYAAERSDGLFAQQVAIKVIQRRPDQPSLVARFERERRILAGLSHLNIARLFDGGTSSDGLPYLVMEFVDGTPISNYVRDRNLGVRQTVELFLAVCSGVEHAHRHFIVHRDIKPANILVTADGVVKLLDFGIATMIDVPSEETQTLALTLEYASPEQVRGETVTAATDVYSLGGVLYHLLTGDTPLQLGHAPLGDCLRAIAERTPRNPLDLRPAIGRDLSYIVLRALRKEPDRRYPSVEALRLDLERYLKGRPVEARGNSPLYLATRFLRRRWLPVAAAVLVFGSTVAGLVLSRRAQARAEQSSQVAEHASHVADQARLAAEVERRKAEESGRRAERQRELADEQAVKLREQFERANRNLKAARVAQKTITDMFNDEFSLGHQGEALALLDQWLRFQRERFRANPGDQDARMLLGILEATRCVLVNNAQLAPPSCEASIGLLEALFNTPRDNEWLRINLAMARSTLGRIRVFSGKAEEGIALCRRSLSDVLVAGRLNPDDSNARFAEAALRLNLAEALAFSNRTDEAIRAYGESYGILRSSKTAVQHVFAQMTMGLSGIRFSPILAKRNPLAAEKLMEDALGVLRVVANSPRANMTQWNEYANALNECPYPRLHNKDDALIYAKRAAEASKNSNPFALDTLAWAFYYSGDRARALETERQALRMVPSGSSISLVVKKSLERLEKKEP